MTNEEAKEALRKVRMHFFKIGRFSDDTRREACEALNMAIETLQAKTDGDLISRHNVINEIKNVYDDVLCCKISVQKGLPEAVRRVEMMPPAGSKTGKWIEHEWAEEYNGLLISNYECTNCHSWERNNTDFCPNCGADMRGGKNEKML